MKTIVVFGAGIAGLSAAKAIDNRVSVIDQYFPRWLRIICRTDDLFHAIKGPQVIDIAIGFILFFTMWYLIT